NNGVSGVASWIENRAGTDDPSSSRRVFVTFIVRHDADKSITGVAVDNDWDGNDNTASNSVSGATVTRLSLGTNPSSNTVSSLVPFNFDPGRPGDFGCTPVFGSTTRRVDKTIRFKVVDSSNQRSGTVQQNFHWVENDQCTTVDDFAALET